MKDDDIESETNDNELVLEVLEFSTSHQLYLTENIKKNFWIFTEDLLKITIWQLQGMFLMFVLKK